MSSTTAPETRNCSDCGRELPANRFLCAHCGTDNRTTKIPFVCVPHSTIVMRGCEFVCRAVSHNFGIRIANALNAYTPNRRGH